ncbi:hypothetical protein GCM10007301_24450 [Azorhizobium oxalatiphilum]|uniref:Glycosyltransferase n=1 Tax=Azorhizobium oxalatiphilum TaxID=980631 RepID=A0A917FBP0_9HYPH|nr:glycosyltransferase [Azorhizobium oxalatiphilum]GGF63771.1 hypothetical protein GCM10007301_24450 [Azorhizobium oxalatiphilum]
MAFTVSIVICTDGRRDSLQITLESLKHLDYRDFEVCIVCGPTLDGTRELTEGWPLPLKVASNPERNLSISRNIGIALASGDIVAFLDDDAVPEPEWLTQIVAAYEAPKVGGAGGFVYDYTGMQLQWRYGTVDRMGRPNLSWERAAGEFNFPRSYNFPHLLGANSTFRRQALLEVGGFDEEFDYYLDETDVICRLIDAGWAIAQLDGAYVHHKYRSSDLRNEAKVLRSWFSILKNKLYFCLVHRHGYHSVRAAVDEWTAYVQDRRNDCDWALSEGHLTALDRERFEREAEEAFEAGLKRGLADKRAFLKPRAGDEEPPAFTPYLDPASRTSGKTYCLFSREYPPGPVGGVGRYVHELAIGLAQQGHQIHVVTLVGDQSRVDFEDGVWVHRLVPEALEGPLPETVDGPIPVDIWRACQTRLNCVREINRRKPVDAVYAVIWDCEGAAVLRERAYPLVVGLQTTMAFWLESHEDKVQDQEFMRGFGQPMLALERELIATCDAVHAISPAIGRDVEKAYELDLTGRSAVVPLGMQDVVPMPRIAPPPAEPGVELRLLFVGRLEIRKGIDVLLEIAPALLAGYPGLQIDIVGNDTIPGLNGRPYRRDFEDKGLPAALSNRIRFHGEVGEEELRGFFHACDVFVSPSRYESFGLVFVEAMMFSKPVIGCKVGGMVDVIAENETGLLAQPGDAGSLRAALVQLLNDAGLRAAMGAAGRRRYEAHFSRERMSTAIADLLSQAEVHWQNAQPRLAAEARA